MKGRLTESSCQPCKFQWRFYMSSIAHSFIRCTVAMQKQLGACGNSAKRIDDDLPNTA